MSIRKKTLGIAGLTVTILVAVLSATSYLVVTHRFARLEIKEVEAHVHHVQNELKATLAALEATAADWAPWDDTYRFVEDTNQDYVNNNLVDSTFTNLRLTFMLFYNKRTELVYSRFFDRDVTRFTVDRRKAVIEAVRNQSSPSLFLHPDERSRISGILPTRSTAYLVTSHPIVTSNFEGPIRGTLILGRALDAAEIDRISAITKTAVTIYGFSGKGLKPAAEPASKVLDSSGGMLIAPISADTIAGYDRIMDLSGRPALVLGITWDRDIYKYGLSTWRQDALAMSLFGLLFIVLLMFVLDRTILNRLGDLAHKVNGVAGTADRAQRLDIRATDEIGQLALSINTMLDSLEHYHVLQLASEKQYRAVVEDQSDLICRTDGQGILTFVNGAFCRFFGGEASTLIGRCLQKVVPDFPGPVWSEQKSGRKDQPAEVFLHATRLALAGTRRLQWRLRRPSSPSQDAGGWQFVGQDITEQVAAQSALQENERYLRELLDSISCGIMVVDTQTRRVVDVNAAGEALFKRKRNDIVGKICHRLVCLKQAGDCPVLDLGQTIDLSQRKLLRADGTILPILKSVAKTRRNGHAYLVESFTDISNLKKAQADLQRSEERYRSFFEEDITGDSLTSLDGTIIDCNRAFARIFGFENVDEIKSLNINGFFPRQTDRPALLKRLQKERKLGAIELELVHRSGRPLYCIANLVGHFDHDGRLTDISAYLFDDTKRVQLEKDLRQAHKLEAIGTLAGGIAHDFNNILSGIMGYTEIAMSELPETSMTVERLDKVLTATHRAKELVQQILTFSRQNESDPRPIKLKPLIKEVLKLMRASLPSTIDIRQRLDFDATVIADPVQIHQVIMNLCTNAGQALKQAGGALTISLGQEQLADAFADRHPGLMPGMYVRISIEDTGEGIPPQIMDRIFDPFFTTKSKTEGTGLGLSVVHGIVHKLGGAITAVSSGAGSRFDVYLPSVVEVDESREEECRPAPMGSEAIVIVDDEEFQVDVGIQMLTSLGYRVTGFTDSIEALNYITGNPGKVDLVISDMTMPHLTGMALAKRLLDIAPHLPIIICSGFSEWIGPEKALSMGIRAFVMKPVLLMELARTVREILDSGAHGGDIHIRT